MKLGDFFRSKRFRVLLCLIAILTGGLLYALKMGGQADIITRGLQNLTEPVRKFSASVSDTTDDALETYYEAKAYREENEKLREHIADLNSRLIGYNEAMQELEALRDQLKIKEKNNGFVLSEPCTNLMPLTNDLSGSFVIDRGSEEGIAEGCPVICSQGLIGVITQVSEKFATVTTILSPELSVSAIVLETGDTGIIEGTLKLAAEDHSKLIYLDRESTVQAGDLVITAGTTGLFPYGIPIGNVVQTGVAETGLTAYATIEPTVDFTALNKVTVLLDFDGKGVSFHEN